MDKGRVFGKETVARVDRVALEVFGGLNDGLDVEVAVERVASHDFHRNVGEANGEGQPVLPAVDDGGFDAEVTKGSEDAQRNLAAVCNQHPLEGHGHWEEHTGYDALGPLSGETSDRKSDTARRRWWLMSGDGLEQGRARADQLADEI